jgi:hypothetical protein
MNASRAFACLVALVVVILSTPTVPTHAATKPCDVMPERCRRGSDGVLYFYPPGYRVPTGIPGPDGVNRDNANAASRAAVTSAVPSSAASSSWGCGATDGKATGRSWGFRNKAAASYRAMAECTQRSKTAGCRIISCSPSVKTYYDAHVAWFADR